MQDWKRKICECFFFFIVFYLLDSQTVQTVLRKFNMKFSHFFFKHINVPVKFDVKYLGCF